MYLDVYDQFLWTRAIYRGLRVRLLWFGVHFRRDVLRRPVCGCPIPYSEGWIRTPLITVGVYRRAPQQEIRRLFTGILINVPGYKAPNQRWPGWEWRWGWWLEVSR